jgi:hypothetical protein
MHGCGGFSEQQRQQQLEEQKTLALLPHPQQRHAHVYCSVCCPCFDGALPAAAAAAPGPFAAVCLHASHCQQSLLLPAQHCSG